MTVISSVCENNTLTLTLRIERGEFAKALDEAYINDTEHYAVPGFAAGLAPREKIEDLYGQTVRLGQDDDNQASHRRDYGIRRRGHRKRL